MSITGQQPIAKDVQLAKFAVFWDDEAGSDLIKCWPASNDPTRFRGDSEDLSEIRSAMKRYEEQEAAPMEDKAYYDARFRLQFTEVA